MNAAVVGADDQRTRRAAGPIPSTRSCARRQANRAPPTSTSCHSHTMMIRLRGKRISGLNSMMPKRPVADSVAPLTIWNSVTVLA
jgi:hypothetical protein